ncbi:hypothetical protein IKQ21_00430 [bacterium]|nr:hypothetical protein [bacterium]
MKVNSSGDISFKSLYANKALKRGLEFAADNGALFAASAAVGFSLARPLAIWLTPKTDKENRELAAAKSITSSLIGFILMLGLSLPLSKSIKNIDKNPEKFLEKKTIEKLKESGKKLENSKGYVFGTQLFKLGLGTVAAIPKAILVALGLPYIMTLFGSKAGVKEESKKGELVFRGSPTDKFAKRIGKTVNKEWFQNFAEKYKDTNFPMHITALTDILATGAFIHQAKISKNIKEERKSALIYNSAISTGLSVAGGYALDKILNKPTEKLIKGFRKANLGQKNLEKQIQGIKIAKPILILGTIYYIFIPFISTFLAEKANDRFVQKG